jgi:hypothetical protein
MRAYRICHPDAGFTAFLRTGTVFRFLCSDLLNTPEEALRASLNFLGEPLVAECLNPLQKRLPELWKKRDFEVFGYRLFNRDIAGQRRSS